MIFADAYWEVTLKVLDKDEFENLVDQDLVLISKDGDSYRSKNFEAMEDEFSYLGDDINWSDSYTWSCDVIGDDKMEFTVRKAGGNDICVYTILPKFEEV